MTSATKWGFIFVVIGATKPEQLEQNVKAGLWRPSAEEMLKINDITPPPGGVAMQPTKKQ